MKREIRYSPILSKPDSMGVLNDLVKYSLLIQILGHGISRERLKMHMTIIVSTFDLKRQSHQKSITSTGLSLVNFQQYTKREWG